MSPNINSNIMNMRQAVFEMFGIGAKEKPSAVPVEEVNTDMAAVAAAAPAVSDTAPPAVPAKAEAVPVMAAPYTLSPVSFLAEGAVWEGSLRSEGDVEVSCLFRGDLTAKGAVTLHATMEGNVTAGSLTLSGCSLVGDVVCDGLMVISRDSRVNGNITAREVRCAGQISGDITTTEAVIFESTARINGNTSTATISVAQGAVIHGGVEIKTED